MLIGRVVHHEIHNDANSAIFRPAGHMIKILQRAVHGIDIHVVGNVITEVHLGRRIARCEPDRVYTEVLEIVEFCSDSLEIADAVIVAVGKTAWIDFIEDRMLPPLVALSIDGFVLRIAMERQEAKANRRSQ